MSAPRIPLLVALTAIALSARPAAAEPPPAATVRAASEVFTATQAIPVRCIPPALLADAQGVAIIPGAIKGGLIIGGRRGHGLVLSRNPDGSWAGPVFVTLTGASVGLQAGVQSTDVILVFKTRASLERVLRGKGRLTLGADVAVAAGPVGREAGAGTNARLTAEVYSYSRSRGLFAGVSLEGAALVYDAEANRAYARDLRPDVLAAAEQLKGQVAAAAQTPPPAPPVLGPLPPLTVPAGPALPN